MTTRSKNALPLVISLVNTEHDDGETVSAFKKEFDHVRIEASNRAHLKTTILLLIAEYGRIDAFIAPMDAARYTPFDRDLLSPLAAAGCRLIVSAKAGYDEFDLDWITEQGIWFCNTLHAVVESTSNLAMYLMLAAVRDVYRAEQSLRGGLWRGRLSPTSDVTNMRLGIIGMGKIGKRVAAKAQIFNMSVRYFNRRRLTEDDEARYNATYSASLHDLLRVSDIVSIHCPLTDSTRNLISTSEFAVMKMGTFLVNTARGAIIDERALIEALECGKVTRAGLDVFCNEPNINSYFLSSQNVICQPHMGGITQEAYRIADRECLENVRVYLERGRPLNPVNNPC